MEIEVGYEPVIGEMPWTITVDEDDLWSINLHTVDGNVLIDAIDPAGIKALMLAISDGLDSRGEL